MRPYLLISILILLLPCSTPVLKGQSSTKHTPLDSFFYKNYDSTFILSAGSSKNLYIVAKKSNQQYFFRYKPTQGNVGNTPGLDCWVTKELTHRFIKTQPDTNRYFSVLHMRKKSFWEDYKIPSVWNITDNYKRPTTCGTVDDGHWVSFTFISKDKIKTRQYYHPFYYADCDKQVPLMKNVVDIYRKTTLYFKDHEIDNSYFGGPGSLRSVEGCDVGSW